MPIDACIAFLHQLDASHVVTVEGLARDGALHPVQRAMIDGYGSQCGFCTPGIVMALAGHFEAGETSARRALTGNLCRCTGYWQILESAAAVDPAAVPRLAELYPEAAMLEELRAAERDEVRIAAAPRELYLPVDLEAACRFKAEHPDCLVVAGATDVAVRRNKGAPEPDAVLALGRRIPGFVDAAIEGDVLHAGAGATWSHLLDLAGARVPALAEILERFGAPQIRNAATIGGNVANASPIADSLPFLYVMGAVVELVGPEGSRRVPIESFYRGYKKLDLGSGELIAGLEIPLPETRRRPAALQDEPAPRSRHRVVHRRGPDAALGRHHCQRAPARTAGSVRPWFACRAPKRSSPAGRSPPRPCATPARSPPARSRR